MEKFEISREVHVLDAMAGPAGDYRGDVTPPAESEWLDLVAAWYEEQAEKAALDLSGAYR
jgi:hypothetical protein